MAATFPPDAGPVRDRHVLPHRGRRTDHHPHPRLAALVVVQAQIGHVGAEQPLGLSDDQGQHPVGVDVDVGEFLRTVHQRALLLVAGALPLHEVPELQGELVLGVQLLELDRGRGVRRRVAQHLVVPGQRRLVDEEPEINVPLHHLVAPVVASSRRCRRGGQRYRAGCPT